MNYRIRSNGSVATQGEVRKMFANTSLPRVWDEAVCEMLGIDPIFEGPQATGGTVYQYSVSAGIEQVNGKWFTKFVLGPTFTDTTTEDGTVTTAAENEAAYKAKKDAEQAKSVRATRDAKLAETDWTQVVDSPFDQSKMAELQAYRQALRDVTAQAGFPWTVEWPVKPE